MLSVFKETHMQVMNVLFISPPVLAMQLLLCPLPIFEKKSKPLPFVRSKLCGSFHGFAAQWDTTAYVATANTLPLHSILVPTMYMCLHTCRRVNPDVVPGYLTSSSS